MMTEMNAESLRRQVVESYRKEDWPGCMAACEALKELYPENAGIALKLADVYYRGGRRQEAIALFNDVAKRYARGGDFLKAIGVYKMILKMDPHDEATKVKLESLCSGENSEDGSRPLPDIPLLSDLEEAALKGVVNSLNHISLVQGDVICREGGEGDSLYIIIRGEVKVYIAGVAGEKIEITRLKEGDFFGEVGLLTGGTRQASVMATEETELLEITKEALEKIEAQYPRVRDVLQDFYKRRVLDKIMALSPLFGSITEKDRHDVLGYFTLKSYEEGQVVIREGESGDSLYIIKSGQAEVTTLADDGKRISLSILKEGSFFGEVALLTGKPRTATVTAVAALELMELSRKDLTRLTEKFPAIKAVLQRYLKARVEKTIDTMMALKRMNAKEGLV